MLPLKLYVSLKDFSFVFLLAPGIHLGSNNVYRHVTVHHGCWTILRTLKKCKLLSLNLWDCNNQNITDLITPFKDLRYVSFHVYGCSQLDLRKFNKLVTVYTSGRVRLLYGYASFWQKIFSKLLWWLNRSQWEEVFDTNDVQGEPCFDVRNFLALRRKIWLTVIIWIRPPPNLTSLSVYTLNTLDSIELMPKLKTFAYRGSIDSSFYQYLEKSTCFSSGLCSILSGSCVHWLISWRIASVCSQWWKACA